MNKNNSESATHDDEIDLYDLFRRIGKTLSKWFKAIGRGILTSIFFLTRNIIPLALSILLGIGLSYLMKWSSKPFYKSEITLRSNAVPTSEMIAVLNKLKLLLKEKNIQGIESSLSLSKENVVLISDQSLVKPEFSSIKRNGNRIIFEENSPIWSFFSIMFYSP